MKQSDCKRCIALWKKKKLLEFCWRWGVTLLTAVCNGRIFWNVHNPAALKTIKIDSIKLQPQHQHNPPGKILIYCLVMGSKLLKNELGGEKKAAHTHTVQDGVKGFLMSVMNSICADSYACCCSSRDGAYLVRGRCSARRVNAPRRYYKFRLFFFFFWVQDIFEVCDMALLWVQFSHQGGRLRVCLVLEGNIGEHSSQMFHILS